MRILVVDIGGTSLKCVVMKNGQFRSEFITKSTYKIGVNELVAMLVAVFNEFDDLNGIALASPGAIEKGQYVNFWTAIEGLSQGFDLGGALHKRGVNVPVSIINDANAAALGEYKMGAGKNYSTMVFLGVGSGIGTGTIYHGMLIDGHHGFGSEFGSSFEIWNQQTNRYESPQDHGGFHALSTKWTRLTNRTITGKEIFTKYDDGDPHAVEIVDQFYQTIARVVLNIVMTINPGIIVLGGGLAYRNHAPSEIEQAFLQLAKKRGIPMKTLNLKRTTMHHQAALYGAYYHHLKVCSENGSQAY